MGLIELIVIAGVGLAVLAAVALVFALIRREESASSSTFGSGFEGEKPAFDSAAMQEITESIRSGNKIQAIKVFRDRTGVDLAEAKRAIDELERNLRMPGKSVASGGSDPRGLDDKTLGDIRELLRTKHLIDAIKVYREATGVGLKEAKDAVDGIKRNM